MLKQRDELGQKLMQRENEVEAERRQREQLSQLLKQLESKVRNIIFL